MKRWVILLFCILILVSIFTACGGDIDSSVSPTPTLSKTKTPIPTNTSTLTQTPTVTPTPTITLTPTATPLPYFAGASKEEVLVIVAEFENRSDDNGADLDIASSIYERINKDLPEGAGNIRLKFYPQPVEDADEAQRLLETYDAFLLVRGWFDPIGAEIDMDINLSYTQRISLISEVQMDLIDTFSLGFSEELLPQANYVSLLTLGLISNYLEDHQEALDCFSKAMSGLGKFSVESIHPEIAYYWRGITFNQVYQYEAAIADFNKAIKFEPGFASAYNNRGFAYESSGQYEEALLDFNKAIELDQGFLSAYNNRGVIYSWLGQNEDAVVNFNKAIELDSEFAPAYYDRCRTYFNLDQYDQAIADCTKAIELAPDYAWAYGLRGNIHMFMLNDDLALIDYTKAIELAPEFVIAYFLRGNAYEGMRKYQKAFDDFTKVIELYPEFGPAYRERGNIYFQWNQYDEAIADLTKAVELNPEDYYGYYIRGFIYQKLGQSDLAIADFEKAITDYTEHPYYLEAYCNLADIYLNQGRNDLAAKYYETGSALTDDIFWCYSLSEKVLSLTETP